MLYLLTKEAPAARQREEYRGYLTMSLVQRLMSAGHGGQILLSNTVENLLRDRLPAGVILRDMGEHKFKDVPRLTHVYQVLAPDLQWEFPPLRTLSMHPNNLPTQLTSFVGREKELADVKKLLQHTHLLTLIGPGGTGKTRLSIQAAGEMLHQYPDGVWLVELAPILDPVLVPRTTAIAIGLRDEPQRPVIDMLCDYLGSAARDRDRRGRHGGAGAARSAHVGARHQDRRDQRDRIRLVSSRDLAEVARLATSSAVFILEADHAILRMQDPETRRFVIRSYYGSADGRTQEKLFLLDKQLAIDTLRGQRTRVISDLPGDAGLGALAGGFRSALVAPLRREGRVVGTLALYDKVSPDRFFAGAFGDDDLHIFSRFVTYVERGIENATFHARTQRGQSFDEETGLPNADYLARRVDQEIARAGEREGALALVSCKLDNLHELRTGPDARRAELLVKRA